MWLRGARVLLALWMPLLCAELFSCSISFRTPLWKPLAPFCITIWWQDFCLWFPEARPSGSAAAIIMLADLCVSVHVSICLFNKRYTSVTPAKGIILPHTDITMTYFKAKYCIFAVSSPLKEAHFVLVLYIHGCKPRCPQHLSGNN